jgi:hypothetical protein
MDLFVKHAAKKKLIFHLKEKTARLSVSDIEDDLGMYLSDKEEQRVRDLISTRRSKSFSMRHPLLTGIPTLGIAPMIANANAQEHIIRRLARDSSKMRSRIEQARKTQRAQEMEEYRLETERERATQPSKAVAGAMSGMLPLVQAYKNQQGQA